MDNIWTAISREIDKNGVIAVSFISTNKQRIRIPAESLWAFFNNNRVTNLIYNVGTGEIEGDGIPLEYLDTYKCTAHNRCNFKPGVGEIQLIQLADRNIKKYKKELMSERSSESIEEAGKKLALAASVVGVVGVVAGTTAKGIKNVGKGIENNQVKNLKHTVYNKLKKYNRLLDQIIEAKYNTNRLYEQDNSITAYDRNIECIKIRNAGLKQDILEYGITQYLKNIETLINICMEPMIKYNLMDDSLREVGAETTIRQYRESLDAKIGKVIQLHLRTKQLLINNTQSSGNNTTIESRNEQHEKVTSVEAELRNIETRLSDVQEHHNQDIPKKLELLQNINLQRVKQLIDTLEPGEVKDEYCDYVYSLESIMADLESKYKSQNKEKVNKSIVKSLNDLEVLIDDTQNMQDCSANELRGIIDYITTELNGVKDEICRAPIELRAKLTNKITIINSKLQSLKSMGGTNEA